MRLFIAVEIPENISKLLFALQEKLLISGRVTKTKSFHLTLKFLGDTEDEKLPVLVESLSQIVFKPFELSLSQLGVFPDAAKPRVVWIGLSPNDMISSLQKQVDQVTQRIGFKADKRFHPHLTLARIRFLDDKNGFMKSLGNIVPPKESFVVNSFKLIRSTLTPEGPLYDVVKSFSAQ